MFKNEGLVVVKKNDVVFRSCKRIRSDGRGEAAFVTRRGKRRRIIFCALLEIKLELRY